MSRFTILTVCTGNICRSPLAEDLLRLELRGVAQVSVSSAGTAALAGVSMQPDSRRIAERLIPGYDRAHMARQLDGAHVRGADLILAMSREHRRAVVELLPRASRITFTAREFARLSDEARPDEIGIADPMFTDDIGDRMRDAVDTVASLRGSVPPLADPLDDDVVDPYGRALEVYEESAGQLVPAIQKTAQFLRRAASGGV